MRILTILLAAATVLLGACATPSLGPAYGPERTWVKTAAHEWVWRDGQTEIRAVLLIDLMFNRTEVCPRKGRESFRGWGWKAGAKFAYAAYDCTGQRFTAEVATLSAHEAFANLPPELEQAYNRAQLARKN